MKKTLIALATILTLSGCGSTTVKTPVSEPIAATSEKEEEILTIQEFAEPIVIIDNEDIIFTVKSIIYSDFWDSYGLKVYMENKTDKNLMFSWEGVSINDYMNDPFWANEVAAGKKDNSQIMWSTLSLADDDITYDTISNIEFTLSVYHYDNETWDSTCYLYEKFVINI